jgi:small subunit ribosomal protein S16
MAVKLRLQRHGRKGRPYYYIVAANVTSKRDGRYIERVGSYNPVNSPATIDLDVDASLKWLENGAEPTPTVRRILSYKGVLYKKHLMRGVRKGALTLEEAEAKFAEWSANKEAEIQKAIEANAQKIQESKKAKAKKELEKSASILAARRAKLEEAAAPAEEEVATEEEGAPAEEAAVVEAPAEEAAAEEAPAEEAAAEEAPAEEAAAEEDNKEDEAAE